ncbi:MAG: GFA family protein [Deltaproteobacteria bacterium]
MIPGSCLCGTVRYEVEGPLQGLLHCHCARCRKHHGAPFASFAQVSQHQLRWLAGEPSVVDYLSSPSRLRRFCPTCGSVAPTPLGDRVLVPAGNLLGDLGVTGGEHMFVGSRASWHVIADNLPQHEAAAPGWASEVERRAVPAAEGATHGSCLCGAVSFAVSGAPARWLQCHCSRCRRARSSAHGSNTFYPLAQFAWRTGRELVRSYKPPEAERFTVSFCTRCGGGAPTERENVPFVLVPAGLFDADPEARPQAHIHVASKASWYAVQDGLPQFAELPPP